MIKVITTAAMAALTLALAAAPQPAHARGGAIAAGVVGGLAAGAIIGSQAANGYYAGPSYYGPDYYGRPYEPVYGPCHTERQPVEDGYGRVHMRRVRVCE